ncbi:disulfide bond formation protein DsbD [Methylopila jiangsuensis]|uniref:Disulfide bond formation protein DsbD n=1 Tax=Methylopila jiangsuensis TaxID=586230 RepID=A0A9W6JIM2_9HYPH|nr:DsbA family protein [Methylopila jiangsuensis]MDR6286584.1 protein-disulfide isomerase [Methylopila jiangsuensis]GLK77076.1 disulfide bond formation protein DsbD [Methylopila jiangsuensis]
MTLTRRRFLESAAALGLTAAAAALLIDPRAGFVSQALAQAPSTEELAVAGPLGEKAEGREDAPVTIIEYASMTCGHCATFANETFPKLKEKYIDGGKVRFILREFPLDPIAAAGFMIARCAGDDKYFAVVDALFARQKEWAYSNDPVTGLQTLTKQFGFTQESFEACLTNQEMLDGVNWVRQRGAEKFGVNSTPTFFINGKIYRGAIKFEDMEKILEPLLKA